MNVKNMSNKELHIELEKVKKDIEAKNGWLHKSRKYKTIMNEIEIRSGYITNPNLLKRNDVILGNRFK